MTEAAIKRAKKQKLNRILLIISAVVLAVLTVLWIVQFNITNSRAIPQLVEYYEPGEYVEIGDNFYIDAIELLNGYSVKINGARLYEYEEFMIENGCEEELSNQKANNESYCEYIVVMDMNLKNVENYDGYIMALKYALYNGSLNIPVDFTVWGNIDKRFEGYAYLKLLPNSEVELLIPFVPMPADYETDSNEIFRRFLEEDFYFCISEFPVRKMIRVPIENCVE